jgi:hypothetical protein
VSERLLCGELCRLTIRCLRFSISNATLDLLMMAAWNLALGSFPGERIPVSAYPLRSIRLSLVVILALLLRAR